MTSLCNHITNPSVQLNRKTVQLLIKMCHAKMNPPYSVHAHVTNLMHSHSYQQCQSHRNRQSILYSLQSPMAPGGHLFNNSYISNTAQLCYNRLSYLTDTQLTQTSYLVPAKFLLISINDNTIIWLEWAVRTFLNTKTVPDTMDLL